MCLYWSLMDMWIRVIIFNQSWYYLKMFPSFLWWWKNQTTLCFFGLLYLEKVAVFEVKGGSVPPAFTFYLISSRPACCRISMQSAFRSRICLKSTEGSIWSCTFKSKQFAWCGCRVDALASFPRMNEFAPLLKGMFFFLFKRRITVVRCPSDTGLLSCQKVPHLIALWIIKLL